LLLTPLHKVAIVVAQVVLFEALVEGNSVPVTLRIRKHAIAIKENCVELGRQLQRSSSAPRAINSSRLFQVYFYRCFHTKVYIVYMHVDVVINLAHVRPSTGLSELGMNRFGTDVPTNAWNRDKPQSQLKMVMRTVIASFLAKNECYNTQSHIHTMHGPARRTAHPLTIKHCRIFSSSCFSKKKGRGLRGTGG
jgi:hypothetical protein